MKYECDICLFSTNLKSNYTKHFESSKHKDNCTDEKICDLCLSKFSHVQSLNKHKKDHCKGINYKVKIKEEIEDETSETLKTKINNLEKKLVEEQHEKKLIEEKLRSATEKCDILEKDKKYFQKQVNKAGTIIENLSNFNYIKATYKNPPLFMEITDDEIMKLFLIKEEKNIITYKKKKDDNDTCFRKQLLYYNRNNKLDKFLSDILCSGYKDENNPEKQTVWTSDASRLNYAITETINNKELDSDDSDYSDNESSSKIVWTKDKNGLKIDKKAITPILNFAKRILEDHYTNPENLKSEDDVKMMGEEMDIVKKIKDGTLQNKINKRLSAEFNLDRKK